jgi:hypothetical protein
MSIVLGLICIASGLLSARMAYKSYALVLAVTYLFQTLAVSVVTASVFEMDFTWYHVAIPVIIAVIVWIMSKLNFLWLWGSLTLVGLILLASIGMMADTITDVVTVPTVLITYAIALLTAFVLRKHGRVLTVGITSGYNVGMGLILVLMAVWSSDAYGSLFVTGALLVLAGVGAGIYYQYKVDRRLIDSVLSNSTSNA